MREGLSILVVDDEPANRLLFETVLSQAGHLVTTADCGRAAVDAAARAPFDLVLMDLGLPDFNGFEATRRLRAQAPSALVFALTADDDPKLRREGARAGMGAYLTKPISPQDLLEAVGRAKARSIQDA
ncbi:MAG: response regulator [Pseudomonadota bacterium]